MQRFSHTNIEDTIAQTEKIQEQEYSEKGKDHIRGIIEHATKSGIGYLEFGNAMIEIWYRNDVGEGGEECGPLYTVTRMVE